MSCSVIIYFSDFMNIYPLLVMLGRLNVRRSAVAKCWAHNLVICIQLIKLKTGLTLDTWVSAILSHKGALPSGCLIIWGAFTPGYMFVT